MKTTKNVYYKGINTTENNNKHINERLTCNICGCQVCRRGMTRHQKSQKCKSCVKPVGSDE